MLKLHAPGTEPRLLDLQDAALEHVAGDRRARAAAGADARRRGARRGRRAARARLTWVPGTPWAARGAHAPATLASLGRDGRAARPRARELRPPGARPAARAGTCCAATDLLADATGDAAAVLERFGARVLAALRALPAQAIHNDANEHNVLVGDDGRSAG